MSQPLNAWKKRKAATRGPNVFDITCTGSSRKYLFLQIPFQHLSTPNLASTAIPNTTTCMSVLLKIIVYNHFQQHAYHG